MATIGSVTKRDDGRYEGELRTLTIRADIAILPVADKASPNQPDYRVLSQGIEIGAGWLRKGQTSGKEYVSLSISAPEFGSRTLYANLGRAAAQSDPDVLRPDLEPAGIAAGAAAPAPTGAGALLTSEKEGNCVKANNVVIDTLHILFICLDVIHASLFQFQFLDSRIRSFSGNCGSSIFRACR